MIVRWTRRGLFAVEKGESPGERLEVTKREGGECVDAVVVCDGCEKTRKKRTPPLVGQAIWLANFCGIHSHVTHPPASHMSS